MTFTSRRVQLLWGLALSLGLFTPAIARAENPDDVRQLLQTNICENCDLSGATLTGLDLTDAVLTGSDLSNARLDRTVLVRADLRGATLQNAYVSSIDLRGANLQNANLAGIQSRDFCDFSSGAGLLEDCQTINLLLTLGTDLCSDDYGLTNAGPGGQVFQSLCVATSGTASFNEIFAFGFFGSEAWFPAPVALRAANLTNANLSGAHLKSADLRYANLTNANFDRAEITGAFLMWSNWDEAMNADWQGAYLTPAHVADAFMAIAQEQAVSARQQEGSAVLGSINRAQQAYYLEQTMFSPTLSELELGFSETTENYAYEIVTAMDAYTITTATSMHNDLNSYIGIVYLTVTDTGSGNLEQILAALLCESTEPTAESPNVDTLMTVLETRSEDEPVVCPNGFQPYTNSSNPGNT